MVRTDAEKADLPKKGTPRPRAGSIGAKTIDAAEAIIRERGPMSTRELLPLVRAKGIDIDGTDLDRSIAILSARISGRGDLVIYHGKWHFKDALPSQEPSQGSVQKEAAVNPAKDQTAASLFVSREGGESYAPALT